MPTFNIIRVGATQQSTNVDRHDSALKTITPNNAVNDNNNEEEEARR